MGISPALVGRRVMLTGGSAGIGLAAAGLLAANHARVVVLSRTPPPEWLLRSGPVHFVHADLALPGAEARAVEEGICLLGGALDALIVNHGRMDAQPFRAVPAGLLELDWRVNLQSPMLLVQACLPYLERGSRPSIVFNSSLCASRGMENTAQYSASKAGVEGLTRALAVELAESGIRVNAVAPGVIDTELNRRAFLSDEAYRQYLEGNADPALHPVGRVGRPEDVAAAMRFLCDPEQSGFINGQCISVDGGRSVKVPCMALGERPSRATPAEPPGLAVRSLRGRKALVTGAAGGLGLALARALAAEGVDLALVDLQPEAAAAGLRRDFPVEIAAFACDQTKVESVRALGAQLRARPAFGGLDIAVLNAGVMCGWGEPIDGVGDDADMTTFRVLVEGTHWMAKHVAIPLLQARRPDDFETTLVFTGSSSARLGFPDHPDGMVAYHAAKCAQVGLMAGISQVYSSASQDPVRAAEIRRGRPGIPRVAAVDPGYTATGLGGRESLARYGLAPDATAEDVVAAKLQDGAHSVDEAAERVLWPVRAACHVVSGQHMQGGVGEYGPF